MIEFKRIDAETPTEGTMVQLQAKGYADQYHADGRPVYLVATEFSGSKREGVGWHLLSLRGAGCHG